MSSQLRNEAVLQKFDTVRLSRAEDYVCHMSLNLFRDCFGGVEGGASKRTHVCGLSEQQ